MNGQPLRVAFVRSEQGRARLIDLLNENNRAKARSAPVQAILAVDAAFHEHIPALLPFAPEWREVYEAETELRWRTAQLSSSLQAGYFLLAARAVGLSVGPMGGFDSAAVDAEFFHGSSWRSFLVVNLGYPGDNAWFERLPRLSNEDVLRWQ